MFNSKIFTLLHKTLDFRTQRQDLLTSNIANKDTPGYKAEDMVFEKSLEKALHADKPGLLIPQIQGILMVAIHLLSKW